MLIYNINLPVKPSSAHSRHPRVLLQRPSDLHVDGQEFIQFGPHLPGLHTAIRK